VERCLRTKLDCGKRDQRACAERNRQCRAAQDGNDRPETRAFIAPLRQLLTVHPLTGETHETGLALAERYGFSTWDGMIVASALLAGCDVLWTEDLQDGMEIEGGLKVRTPFI